MGLATAAATVVALFPYGNQFVLDWPATTRVTQMAAQIERRIPPGPVGIGIRYKGPELLPVRLGRAWALVLVAYRRLAARHGASREPIARPTYPSA